MKEWLKMLFHYHKWEVKKTTDLWMFYEGKKVICGARYLQQCSLCGKLKNKDVV